MNSADALLNQDQTKIAVSGAASTYEDFLCFLRGLYSAIDNHVLINLDYYIHSTISPQMSMKHLPITVEQIWPLQ